jgi:hypothetical protein
MGKVLVVQVNYTILKNPFGRFPPEHGEKPVRP